MLPDNTYAIIQKQLTHDGVAQYIEWGYGIDRVSIQGFYESFARLVRQLGIREIQIIGTYNKLYHDRVFTFTEALNVQYDMVKQLKDDKGNKRGKPTVYVFKVIDPYTCEVINQDTFKV